MRDGDTIGPYRVIRKIGAGGMGAVFLGEHALIGRHAAIKVLLPELSSKRESVDRFFNEARAITAISDPGIVQVFDFGFTKDRIAYIVMELLEGEQLSARLTRLGALPPVEALRIARQVAGSLGAAHAAGIVHRDLKPENLYMVRDRTLPGGERAKILDFGVAKLDDEVFDRRRTRTGVMLGTPIYMSPEQCNGASRVDHRADIYSLGCVLFHLLTGQPPFDLPGLGAIISAHMREPAPPPSSLALISADLDDLVLRCLAKAPGDRFATMLEVQEACDAILARLGPGEARAATDSAALAIAARPPSDPPPASRTTLDEASSSTTAPPDARSRRRLGRWMVVAALATGAGAGLALFSSRSSSVEAADRPLLHAEADDALSSAAPPVPAPVPVVIDAGVAPGTAADTNPATGAPEHAAGSDGVRAAAIPAKPLGERAAGPKRPGAAKPAAAKPAVSKPASLKPPKPRTEDLYNDRN